MADFENGLHGHLYQYDLGWMIRELRKNVDRIKNLETWKEKHEPEYTALYNEVKSLEALLESLEGIIQSGSFSPAALQAWANKNMPDLIAQIVKFVFFGISTDGRFVAMIPTSWDFIQFDTIVDPNSDLYGHLILQW